MDPRTDSSRTTQTEAERQLLAALCHNVLDSGARAEIIRCLQNHCFVDPDHEVIFRALAALPRGEPAEIRTKLAQAVTRLGFPDIDFDSLFAAPAPTTEKISALLQEMI